MAVMSKSPLRMTVSGGGAGTGVKELDFARLNKLALAIEEVADDDQISLSALRELADDNNQELSHYVAAVALCTELRWTAPQAVVARVCVGNCQKSGAISIIDKITDELGRDPALAKLVTLSSSACLKQCEQAPACEIVSPHGNAMLAPTTAVAIVAALREIIAS